MSQWYKAFRDICKGILEYVHLGSITFLFIYLCLRFHNYSELTNNLPYYLLDYYTNQKGFSMILDMYICTLQELSNC